jgi:hypothetical protein
LRIAAGAMFVIVFILPDTWLIGPLLTIVHALALAVAPAHDVSVNQVVLQS